MEYYRGCTGKECLPDGVKHGDKRQQRGYKQYHATGDYLRNDAEAAPRDDDEQWWRQVAFQQVSS